MKTIIENDKVEVTLNRLGRTVITEFNRQDKPVDVRDNPIRTWPVLSEHEWTIIDRAVNILESAAIRNNPPDTDCHVSECLPLPEDDPASITLSRSSVFDVKTSIKADISPYIKVDELNGVITLTEEDNDALVFYLEVEYGFTVPPAMLYQIKNH